MLASDSQYALICTSDNDFMQAVKAAQEYSDSVGLACEAVTKPPGTKWSDLYRLVLSPKVHNCYRVAGCVCQ